MMRNVNCDESRNLWTRKETFVSGRPATRIRRKYRKIEEFQCTIALTLCDHSELFLHTFYAISFTQIKTKIALQMGVKEYYFYLDSAPTHSASCRTRPAAGFLQPCTASS
jgi:hypothetical protein